MLVYRVGSTDLNVSVNDRKLQIDMNNDQNSTMNEEVRTLSNSIRCEQDIRYEKKLELLIKITVIDRSWSESALP